MRYTKTIAILSIALFFIVVFSTPHPAAAQPSILFQRFWGGPYYDAATAVGTDHVGNIYVLGSTDSFGPNRPTCGTISLLKYSAQGVLLWQKVWVNSTNRFDPTGLAVDPAGNSYIIGLLSGTCNNYYQSVLLIKIDPAGGLVWERSFPQQPRIEFDGIAVDASGNPFVTGIDFNGIQGSWDILIMRFNSTGDLVWQRTWGRNLNDYGNAITVDSQDNVYVTGVTVSSPSASNLVLLKLDPMGSLVFQQIVGDGNEDGSNVAVDASGNIYTIGIIFAGNNIDTLLLKFDSTGSLVWQKSWGGTGLSTASGLAIDPSGDPEIAGATNSYGGGGTCGTFICDSMLLMKIDASGNILSELVLGVAGSSTGLDSVVDSYGTMVAVGSVNSTGPYQIFPGNYTLATTILPITAQGNNTLGLPAFTITTPAEGSVQSVSAAENYVGPLLNWDETMLRFGDEPRITFSTSPTSGATISFNGTDYSNGQNLTALGSTTITANPAPGYSFTGWSTTGGVFVANPAATTTQLTIVGTGSLTAEFQQTPPSIPPYIIYLLLGVAGAAVVVALFFYTRKNGPKLSPHR